MSREFNEEIRKCINDLLEWYENETVYGCDLGYKITQDINSDCANFCSKDEAIESLKEFWDDASDFFEYWKFNYGKDVTLPNPFADPEKYYVLMVIKGVCSMLSQSNFIKENWNNKIGLTKENIEIILSEIDALNDAELKLF